MNIIQAIEDKEERFFHNCFKDIRTWKNWLVFLRALFGLPIERGSDEHRLFTACTGRETLPERPFREAYAICGRRSGKSFITALVSVFLACFQDWSRVLAAGERGKVFVVAVDKAQAGIIFNYIRGIIGSSPNLRAAVESETSDEIRLRNHVDLAVKTSNFRSVRGYTLLACIVEELAFWRDENSACPDKEFITAIRPSLALVPGSMLLSISSPYSRSGLLYDIYRQHFGQDDPDAPLIWKASSQTMNPTIPQRVIDRAMREDAAVARSEWLAEFRTDVSAFIPVELIEAATVPGRVVLPKLEGVHYFGFMDAAGGTGKDSASLAISHREMNGQAVLDVLLERRPPFSPESVVREFSDTLKSYGVSHVEADRYAGDWVKESFRKEGIQVQNSERTKSEIYLEALPLLASGSTKLLDNKRLAAQLASLERKTRSGGRDSVDVFFGADDLSNATCGSLVLCSEEANYVRSEITRTTLELETREIEDDAVRWLLDRPPKKKPESDEPTDEQLLKELEEGDENQPLVELKRGW